MDSRLRRVSAAAAYILWVCVCRWWWVSGFRVDTRGSGSTRDGDMSECGRTPLINGLIGYAKIPTSNQRASNHYHRHMTKHKPMSSAPVVRFGQAVVGPPGAGKTTYCQGVAAFLRSRGRACAVINLDPANDALPYAADVDVAELVKLAVRLTCVGWGLTERRCVLLP